MRNSSTFRKTHAGGLVVSVVAVVALCGLQVAHAIDPAREVSQYIRDAWETEQGFPGGPVHAIAQTTDGYLWLGTEKGLVRFDGVAFRLFQPMVDGQPAIRAGARAHG